MRPSPAVAEWIAIGQACDTEQAMENDDLDARDRELRLQRFRINFEIASLKLVRAMREAGRSLDRLGMTLQLGQIASADLAEFDNRAHDWMRAGDGS